MEGITSKSYHAASPTWSTFTRTDKNGNVQTFHQYGNIEMMTVADAAQLKKNAEGLTMDSFTWKKMPMEVQWDEKSIDKLAVDFQDSLMIADPRVSDFKRQIDQETQATIEQFYDGGLSEEEFGDAFQALAEKFAKGCWERGYPHPMWDIGTPTDQAALSAFYGEFRRKVLQEAVVRNHEEGKQYVTGGLDMQKNYKYYNSDYYFKSEAAIKAATDSIQSIMDERGYDQFQVKDYKAEGLHEYYNFNTAFSNRFELSEQYMLDPELEPPEHFQWFFQTGGDSSRRHATVDSCTTYWPDGTVKEVTVYYNPTGFDPKDPRTANTWAAFTDTNGQRHSISTDFFFNHSKSDLYNVGGLLHFGAETGADSLYSSVNRFLANLQAYPKGYFNSAAMSKSINFIM